MLNSCLFIEIYEAQNERKDVARKSIYELISYSLGRNYSRRGGIRVPNFAFDSTSNKQVCVVCCDDFGLPVEAWLPIVLETI